MLTYLVVSAGGQQRRRATALPIAATAHAHRVQPLSTRDATDLVGLKEELTIRVV